MKTLNTFSKYQKSFLYLLGQLAISILFTSCAVPIYTKTDVVYEDTRKSAEQIQVKYSLPLIVPTSTTVQTQVKGGITITTEIAPLDVERYVEQKKEITYADPKMPGYDMYEVKNIPAYRISSIGRDHIQFKIRIRNNEKVPLILSQVGFLLAIDGISFSFPEGYIKDWNEGLIITGEEKTYTIIGPSIEGLTGSRVVRLFLNGVPVLYDEAGQVKKKDSFEWFFECKTQEVTKDEEITYTYESSPIHKEQCQKCYGTGADPQFYKCSACNGKGTYVNVFDKKTYTCRTCSGKGMVRYKCSICNGVGVISLPKSSRPPVKSSILWRGAQIHLVTIPPGATVSVINTTTREYESAGMSNIKVSWYTSSSKSYPIKVSYQGKNVSVFPYNPETGKLISKVVVDFTPEVPVAIEGRLVD